MSNNISANTLFHFTRRPEVLINIIRDGFYPTCCMENLEFIYREGIRQFAATGYAIPMVCFCDIPLSQISFHVKNFGGYALGLSKEWGETNGINPVMYELPNSNAIETIREAIHATIPYLMGQSFDEKGYQEKMRKLGNELIFFSCYLKPYKGQKWDGESFNGDEIVFYDEREWRYIPNYSKILEKALKPYLFTDDFLDENKKNEFNEMFRQHFKLDFKPKDIKYIIVEKESEVLNIAKEVYDMKSHFDEDVRKLLMTKIMSIERLEDDF